MKRAVSKVKPADVPQDGEVSVRYKDCVDRILCGVPEEMVDRYVRERGYKVIEVCRHRCTLLLEICM